MEIPIKKEEIDKYRKRIKDINLELSEILKNEPIDIKEFIKKSTLYKIEISQITSHALINKNHWKKIIDKINIQKDSIVNKLKYSPNTDEKMSTEIRKSYAESKAEEIISETMFDGQPFHSKMASINSNHIDADSLYNEAKMALSLISDMMMAIGILNKTEKNSDISSSINL